MYIASPPQWAASASHKSLVQAHLIDRLADLLEDCVHIQAKPEVFRARLLHDLPLKEPDDEREISVAYNTRQSFLIQ